MHENHSIRWLEKWEPGHWSLVEGRLKEIRANIVNEIV
jgi:hypothetical protein